MAINSSFIGELKYEAALTRKLLERVPMDQKEWRPHEKSMTLGRLATHIAEIPHWIAEILTHEEFDFTSRPYQPLVAGSSAELLHIFHENIDSGLAALEKATDTDFDQTWIVKRGEHIVMQAPKKTAIRGWAYSHLFHHRGQLSVYLRLLGVPVPGMYGPSADER